MLDFARLDHRLLEDVAEAVHELVNHAGVDPARIMLVGARCRDALHSALGRTTPTRETDDLDLAVAIASWQEYARIGETFPSIRENDIAYRIANLPVDIVPFGAVAEDPRGLTRPAPRKEDIVVFGFREVFDRAASLELSSGESIRIPQPEGYTLLKVRAWVDRAPDDKDAKDLAVALDWYAESGVVHDRLYGDDINVTESYGFDLARGAANLLGGDVRRQLDSRDADDLAERFAHLDSRHLARELILPQDTSRRTGVVRAFSDGLNGNT
ncbi:hypothetical protein [Microbacterium sp.]|jgi:predicted nucleotidyltransferase|uniref:hypothetical protein n=1 Tax=Microbacterium sp. TaxID=51671 RepID=UPI0025D2FC28|nr:hypothetical protein [Microbacterium sp.]MBT9606932.1 hypothetical protein [Microbacterium sp.]